MLGILKRHEVQVLLKAGHGPTEVSQLAGVSLASVKRILKEDPVSDAVDASEHVQPLVRLEGLPGEFSQHDFGQVNIELVDGTIQRVRFFASRLKYSRLVRVSLVKDETRETLVRNLAHHLDAWAERL